MNENLVSNPALLLSKVSSSCYYFLDTANVHYHQLKQNTNFSVQPIGEGYIAIVQPKFEEASTVCSRLLTEDQYQEKLKERRDAIAT